MSEKPILGHVVEIDNYENPINQVPLYIDTLLFGRFGPILWGFFLFCVNANLTPACVVQQD
jgi:hypothetical protein